MKNPRLFAAWLLVLTGLGAATFAAENIPTPEQLFPQLDGILTQAIAQSPRMISRAIELEIAEEGRIAARASLLPSAGGYYSFTQAKDDRGDGNGRYDVAKLAYNFSINQPLYHWGERKNQARMGEIRQVIAQGGYRDGYRLLAQEVRSQYLRLIVNKLIAQKSAFYADHTSKLLRQAEERLAKKVISEAQIFSIRLDAERAQISLERTNFEVENQKASFARLTGLPALSDAEIPDMIPAIADQSEPVQRLLAGYLAQKDPLTAEAETFRNTLLIEELNLKNQKVRLMPKFNLVLGASQDEQSYTIDVAQTYLVNSYYAGVSLNWTIFDGFSAGAGVRTARARVRQLQIDYRNLTASLAQQAQSQAKMATFSARYASINDRLLVSSEGNLRAKNEDFNRGVSAEEDVSVAKLGFYDAQINAYTSRADYFNQLCAFLGTVMEDPILDNLVAK